MNNPSDYHAIALWGLQLGSLRYYIERQQEQAAEHNAPVNALYMKEGGTWRTTDDLSDSHPFQADYAQYLADLASGAKQPYYSGTSLSKPNP